MGKLSCEYYKCLQAAMAHHESSKTYSGKFLRPHAPFIKEIMDRLGCQSVLDYGCGKGSQYMWRNADPTGSIPVGMTIEEFWARPVTKFDPAYRPFAAEPQGTFDMVLCTHVLGSIPNADLPEIIRRLFAYANKALYIAEKLGPVQKEVFKGMGASLFSQFSADDWADLLRPKDERIEVVLATRQRTDHGVIVTRRRL